VLVDLHIAEVIKRLKFQFINRFFKFVFFSQK